MSFRWAGIRYPTPFVFKWCSRLVAVDRRGQKVRQNDFDQKGGAHFEFEDGTIVYASQNAVNFYSKEIRAELFKHVTFTSTSKYFVERMERKHKKERKRRFEKRKAELIEMARSAGINIRTKCMVLTLNRVPNEIHAAVKYAAGVRNISMAQWLFEAVKAKLDLELFDPDSPVKMVIKEVSEKGKSK